MIKKIWKYLPWVLAFIILIAFMFNHRCNSRIIQKTKYNEKKALELVEKKDAIVKELKEKYKNAIRDIGGTQSKVKKLKKKVVKNEAEAKKRIKKLEFSNKTWKEKFYLLRDEYYKRHEVKDLIIFELEIALVKAKYAIDDQYNSNLKLVKNLNGMKGLFDDQVFLTKKAVKNNKIFKAITVGSIVVLALKFAFGG